jgi:hypothetical protein
MLVAPPDLAVVEQFEELRRQVMAQDSPSPSS